ncbi:MAG: hypothetical protein HKO81_04820 [Flavobacteriaceae bacterium]|nr:hypothetical protein [Bacteroidia bacterium]NNL15948.1 hypothetical protein [Flavobacteriaceae bacterium]
MTTQVIFNSDLHFEHMQWKKELLFWKDEIKSFQNRLDEIIQKWSDDKVLAELGQFQNNFTSQNKKIRKYLNAIDSHEHNMAAHLNADEDCIDRVHMKHHEDFRDKMSNQRIIYNELKHKYYLFLTKYL